MARLQPVVRLQPAGGMCIGLSGPKVKAPQGKKLPKKK